MTDLKKVVVAVLLIKIFIVSIIVSAFFLLPFSMMNRTSNFVDHEYQSFSLQSAFMSWDAQHYLFLSDHGYRPGQESNRFYPLFPGVIRISSLFFHNSFWGGLVVSNLLSLCGIVLFYFFVKRLCTPEIAWKSTFLLLAFPTSFYLSLIYSESLFLFLVMCFFYFLYRKQFFFAGIFSFFLPVTRPVGIFILFPFLVFYAQYVRTVYTAKRSNIKGVMIQGLNLLWPIAGLGFLLLLMYSKTGNFFETFILDKTVVGRWDVFTIFRPDIFFQNLFSFSLVLHGFTNSLLDRLFFVGFLTSLFIIYKKLDKTLFVYALFMGSVPLFGNFMSYTRYMLMAFPFFIILGIVFTSKKYHFFFIPFLFFLVMLQTLFLILHSLNYWVA